MIEIFPHVYFFRQHLLNFAPKNLTKIQKYLQIFYSHPLLHFAPKNLTKIQKISGGFTSPTLIESYTKKSNNNLEKFQEVLIHQFLLNYASNF